MQKCINFRHWNQLLHKCMVGCLFRASSVFLWRGLTWSCFISSSSEWTSSCGFPCTSHPPLIQASYLRTFRNMMKLSSRLLDYVQLGDRFWEFALLLSSGWLFDWLIDWLIDWLREGRRELLLKIVYLTIDWFSVINGLVSKFIWVLVVAFLFKFLYCKIVCFRFIFKFFSQVT